MEWTASQRQNTPYADWFEAIGGDHAGNRGQGDLRLVPGSIFDLATVPPGITGGFANLRAALANGQEIQVGSDADLDTLFGLGLTPEETLNPDFEFSRDFRHDKGDLPELPENAVIVGVIDTGIALGHRRTQLPDGRTRILGAWQQSGTGGGSAVPFGREFLEHELNTILSRYRGGPGLRDEEAFNRATQTVGYGHVHGHRELDARAAHGTHVLDTAAGLPPNDPMAGIIRIIAINLPSRSVVGLSGSFLQFFVGLGIIRTVRLANEIAIANGHAGYPIVINLSFGQQAGDKRNSGPIDTLMRAINLQQMALGFPEVVLVLPAGNDNLEQGNAALDFGGENPNRHSLNWRVKPDDQSSNYVEVWTDPFPIAPAADPTDIQTNPVPIEIGLDLPDGRAIPLSAGIENHFIEIPDIVRIFCTVFLHPQGFRVRYVICGAPTILHEAGDGAGPSAPAGLWRITLKTDAAINVSVGVQTDQSRLPEGMSGRRSYFDHPDYRRLHDTTGRVINTYAKRPRGSAPILTDIPGPVFRRGTLNALSTSNDTHIVCIAGHRHSDGAIAPYSSSGAGLHMLMGTYDGVRFPYLSMPTDDGAAHQGILSAGARDGSAIALQGTSFAAAQMTAMIAAHYAAVPRHSSDTWRMHFKGQAMTNELIHPHPYPMTTAHVDISGHGRLTFGRLHRLARMP